MEKNMKFYTAVKEKNVDNTKSYPVDLEGK